MYPTSYRPSLEIWNSSVRDNSLGKSILKRDNKLMLYNRMNQAVKAISFYKKAK